MYNKPTYKYYDCTPAEGKQTKDKYSLYAYVPTVPITLSGKADYPACPVTFRNVRACSSVGWAAVPP